MYQYLNAQAVSDAFDGRYYPVDISQDSLVSVFEQYSKIFVYLKRISDNVTVALDLYKLPYPTRVDTRTIVTWLTANGNLALPTETALPTISYLQAKFMNVWDTTLKVKPGNGQYHPDVEISDDQKTDVWLTNSTYGLTQYRQIVENCLFTCNGFIHRADYSPNGVSIFDANTSKGVQDDTRLGVLDFRELGGIEVIDIDRSNITRTTGNQPLKKGIYVKLPKSVQGTTPLLVIGGYLLPMNRCYRMVSDDVLKVELNYFNWAERFIEAREWINLSGLDIETVGEDAYSLTSLYSDETFRRLIDHRQTFVVLVKTTDVRVGKFKLFPTNLPNCFETHRVPTEPLILGDGRLAEYKVMRQGSKIGVFIAPTLRDTSALDQTDMAQMHAIARRRQSHKPYDYEDAYLLSIIKTVTS